MDRRRHAGERTRGCGCLQHGYIERRLRLRRRARAEASWTLEVPISGQVPPPPGSGLGQYPLVPRPLEVLMTQQLFSRYPADVVEHGKLGAHLALLMPPLAALLYPFLLEAFHANIAPVISGQSAEPALQSAAALSRRRTSVYPPRQQPGCGGHRGTQRTRRTRAPGAKAEEPLVSARLRHDLTRDRLCAVGAAGLGADNHDRYERARRR